MKGPLPCCSALAFIIWLFRACTCLFMYPGKRPRCSLAGWECLVPDALLQAPALQPHICLCLKG